MSIQIYDVSTALIIDEDARKWCKLPYPGHPKGCPNYGVNKNCPPQAPQIAEYVNLQMPIYFIVIPFNLAEHEKRMLTLHPNWSVKQARCCLYWQNGVRKELDTETAQFARNFNAIYTLCPEAMGVDVVNTLKAIGVPIEIQPKIMVHKVALMGTHV